jgi:hypothetical protein
MTDKHGQPFVRGEADSIALLLGSLAGAWGMGLQAWQALAGMGAGSQSDHPGAALVALMGPQPRQAATAQMADISPALAEACMVGAASAMRYWSALAELGLRYEASLVQTVADQTTGRSVASPAECRVYADELRAFLRGVGDAANLEARLLQRDLERVGETIAQAADEATPSHHHERRRRHEVKP